MNTLAKYLAMNRLDTRHITPGYIRRIVSAMSTEASKSTTKFEEEIEIPDRIERSPTDILEALASTVGKDYTAPHYRYYDDPWLTPYTTYEKRNFWIAKESGRNAARYILDRHPSLFEKNRIVAEPPIHAFQPRAVLNIDNVTPELLDNYISNLQVEDGVTVYKLLKEKKKRISGETEQALLELLAYNAEEEELTFENRTTKGMIISKTNWSTGGLAEQLYSSLQTPEARLAVLVGTAKYQMFSRTSQMWEEMAANEDMVPVEGYNAIIYVQSANDFNELKGKIIAYLTKMKTKDISPNEDTLVSCLSVVARFISKVSRNTVPCTEFALSLLTEFKNIGVQPSLGVYYNLLNIFYTKSNKEKSMILVDILDDVEARENLWPAKTLDDFNFFHRAMEVARHLNQIKLSYRIHDLLHTGNNQNFLTSFQISNYYYKHLLSNVLKNEPLDVYMSLYEKLVPQTYSPMGEHFMDILMAINTRAAVQYIGKIYDDLELLQWGETKKESAYEMNMMVLRILENNPSETSEFFNLGQTYVDVAYRIFKHLDMNKANKNMPLRYNTSAAGILSLVIKILLTEGQFEKAQEVFNFCEENKNMMAGQLKDEVLLQLMEDVVDKESVQTGLEIVEYLLSINSTRARESGLKLATLKLPNDASETLNKMFAQDQKWKNI